jgi:hypothetical protein
MLLESLIFFASCFFTNMGSRHVAVCLEPFVTVCFFYMYILSTNNYLLIECTGEWQRGLEMTRDASWAPVTLFVWNGKQNNSKIRDARLKVLVCSRFSFFNVFLTLFKYLYLGLPPVPYRATPAATGEDREMTGSRARDAFGTFFFLFFLLCECFNYQHGYQHHTRQSSYDDDKSRVHHLGTKPQQRPR